MTNQQALTRLAALCAAAVLTACGGGGSDSPASPAPASPADAPSAPPPASPPPATPPAETPGFSLALSTDKALVIQGQTATITATVTRKAGFDGAVSVVLNNLPAGVSAAAVIITAGATSAPILLSATASAAHSLPTAVSANGAGGTGNAITASQPLTVTVGGRPGMVDTSFGISGGAQLTDVGEGEDYAFAMAVQADGKVVTVGRTSTNVGGTDIAITRHLRDGTLDPAFGNGGKVVTAIAPGRGADEARAVLIEPDGKIVIGGYSDAVGTDKDFLVARYNPNGTLDTTFGDGGKTVTNIGNGTDQVYALARQADGKIVAGGSAAFSGSTGLDFALIRYHTNGTLDAGFGTGGKVTTAIGTFGASELIYAITLQTIGNEQRIVAVGGEGSFIAARYLPNGQLDPAFGSAGKIAALMVSTIGSAETVTIAADNKIVIGGHIGHEFNLVQLNADGSPDAGFGTGGRVITPVSATNWDEATSVVRQADGKLLVGGWVYDGVSSDGNFVVLRYEANGQPDAGFGNAGRVVTNVSPTGRSDSGRALSLQLDERITTVPTVRVLQAGEASDGGYKFALLRYWL